MHEFLNKYFRYYQQLSGREKGVFVERARLFIDSKKFIPKGGQSIDRKVEVLIAAVAIQMTFGLKKFLLPHFGIIIVYPRKYLSVVTKRYHRGEVNLRGGIVLSWEDLLLGLKNPDDGFNVGFHEFAHAVYFENAIKNEDYLFLDGSVMKSWASQAKSVISKMKRNIPVLFRDYASTNIQEFFAVTSEYFFEVPADFKAEFPELYITMCRIYNQDPSRL
jgi:hypothetical protein